MRAVGYSCLGVGVASTITGFLIRPYFTEEGLPDVGAAVFGAGIGLTLIGVPLLLIANRHKNKAKEQAFTMSTGIIVTPKENIPALSVRMKFKTP